MALVVMRTMAGQAWVAHPNRALSSSQTRRLLLAAAAICGGIALSFSAFGAWPVLPFAGLEIAALWLALRHLRRHVADEERLEFDDTHIRLTRCEAGRRETREFSRCWTQLRIEGPPRQPACRLFLRSHGREAEIGRLLTDAQKRRLAARLGPAPGGDRR